MKPNKKSPGDNRSKIQKRQLTLKKHYHKFLIKAIVLKTINIIAWVAVFLAVVAIDTTDYLLVPVIVCGVSLTWILIFQYANEERI